MDSTASGRTPQADSLVDASEIAFIVKGIRKIGEAGLLRDFEMTVANELRQLTQRQRDAWYRDDGTGRYVARLLGIDLARCEAIALDTRAQVIISEVQTYLAMIEQRAQRDAERLRDTRPPIPPGLLDSDSAETPITIRSAAEVPTAVRVAQRRMAAR